MTLASLAFFALKQVSSDKIVKFFGGMKPSVLTTICISHPVFQRWAGSKGRTRGGWLTGWKDLGWFVSVTCHRMEPLGPLRSSCNMETKPKAAAVCPICTRERAMNDLTLPYGHYWHSKTDTKQRSSKAGVLASISGAFFRPSLKRNPTTEQKNASEASGM